MNFLYFGIVLSDFVVMCLIIATIERVTDHVSDAGAFFLFYEGWNFNSGNYLFTTDTK